MALFVRRRWPWAVAAVGVLAAVVLAVSLATNADDRPGPAASASANPDTPATPDLVPDGTLAPVTTEAVLSASDAQLKSYQDHQLTTDGVNVLEVVGPDTAWIGDSAENRVLLVTVSPERQFTFKSGTRLAFTGTLRPLTREFAEALGLRGAALDDAAAQGTFVEVSDFRTV